MPTRDRARANQQAADRMRRMRERRAAEARELAARQQEAIASEPPEMIDPEPESLLENLLSPTERIEPPTFNHETGEDDTMLIDLPDIVRPDDLDETAGTTTPLAGSSDNVRERTDPTSHQGILEDEEPEHRSSPARLLDERQATPDDEPPQNRQSPDRQPDERRIARLMLDSLTQDSHAWGCTHEAHAESMERANNNADEMRSIPLTDLHDNLYHVVEGSLTLPDVLHAEEPLGMDVLERNYSTMAMNFDGLHPDKDEPFIVDLELEQAEPEPVRVVFDIDSTLAFPNSLGFIRRGIQMYFSPTQVRNIQSDLHVQATFASGKAKLHKIPHLALGRVVNAPQYIVHVFFPAMPRVSTTDSRYLLTDSDIQRFIDQLLLPAVYDATSSDVQCHLPASYEQSRANGRASRVEQRMAKQQETLMDGGKGISLFSEIQGKYLDAIWQGMLDRVEDHTTTLSDFEGLYLVVSSKNTKLLHKGGVPLPTNAAHAQHTVLGDYPTAPEVFNNTAERSLLDLMLHWKSEYFTHFKAELISRDSLYVDLAREVVPTYSRLRDAPEPDGMAQTLLWRRCCLEKKAQQWVPSRAHKVHTFYPLHFLHDTGAMTTTPPKKHPFFQQGWRYTQRYSNTKEIFDAASTYPFTNEGLDELALDPLVQKATSGILGGSRRDIKAIESAYYASKHRVNEALNANQHKSYGLREEHRISLTLFDEILGEICSPAGSDDNSTTTNPSIGYRMGSHDWTPSYAYRFESTEVFDFMRWTINKYCYGYEYIKATTSLKHRAWEDVKSMALFLRCLRFSVSGTVFSRDTALWATVRTSKRGTVQYGAGFQKTLPTYKIAWLNQVMNWNEVRVRRSLRDGFMFQLHALRDRFLLHNGDDASRYLALVTRLDFCLELISDMLPSVGDVNEPALWLILSLVCHLIFLQFRRDIVRGFKASIRSEDKAEALAAEVPWTYDYMFRITGHSPVLMKGNVRTRGPWQLFRLLFDPHETATKRSWRNKPFRSLVVHFHSFLQQHLFERRPEWRLKLQKHMYHQFFSYHSVVPNATHDALHRERRWHLVEIQRDWHRRNTREAVAAGGIRIVRVDLPHEVYEQKMEAKGLPKFLNWDQTTLERRADTLHRRSGEPQPFDEVDVASQGVGAGLAYEEDPERGQARLHREEQNRAHYREMAREEQIRRASGNYWGNIMPYNM